MNDSYFPMAPVVTTLAQLGRVVTLHCGGSGAESKQHFVRILRKPLQFQGAWVGILGSWMGVVCLL